MARVFEGRIDELIYRTRQELQADPLDVVAAKTLAELYAANANLDKAIDAARTAVRLRPADAEWWGMLGRFLLRRGQPREAVEPLEKSLAIDPIQPTTLTFLAHCYDVCGQPKLAARAAARAASLGAGWSR
jgi:Flp pilus assembly protein TadD